MIFVYWFYKKLVYDGALATDLRIIIKYFDHTEKETEENEHDERTHNEANKKCKWKERFF